MLTNVTVIEDAPILLPNPSHKNFTQSDSFIPKGTEAKGEVKIIQGLRRGEPFTYRLFAINDKLIYLNKVKDMATEVQLGADGIQESTTVEVPSRFNTTVIASMAVLGVGAFWYSSKKGFDVKKKLLVTGVAVLAGYFIGQQVSSNKITILKKK